MTAFLFPGLNDDRSLFRRCTDDSGMNTFETANLNISDQRKHCNAHFSVDMKCRYGIRVQVCGL